MVTLTMTHFDEVLLLTAVVRLFRGVDLCRFEFIEEAGSSLQIHLVMNIPQPGGSMLGCLATLCLGANLGCSRPRGGSWEAASLKRDQEVGQSHTRRIKPPYTIVPLKVHGLLAWSSPVRGRESGGSRAQFSRSEAAQPPLIPPLKGVQGVLLDTGQGWQSCQHHMLMYYLCWAVGMTISTHPDGLICKSLSTIAAPGDSLPEIIWA
jgi:hypothetical protein